mmetsp:Transcript_80396/g.134380  ORF Transcript_80396/g.134380 Transcript_80396/m.134380 type:complete len:89 (+) Transcript_80396:168-434(+)
MTRTWATPFGHHTPRPCDVCTNAQGASRQRRRRELKAGDSAASTLLRCLVENVNISGEPPPLVGSKHKAMQRDAAGGPRESEEGTGID